MIWAGSGTHDFFFVVGGYFDLKYFWLGSFMGYDLILYGRVWVNLIFQKSVLNISQMKPIAYFNIYDCMCIRIYTKNIKIMLDHFA